MPLHPLIVVAELNKLHV